MDSRWFVGHRVEEAKEARHKEILGYRNAFGALREVLENHLEKPEANRDYTSPNWAFQQIAYNEYNQVLKDIYKLLDLNQKD